MPFKGLTTFRIFLLFLQIIGWEPEVYENLDELPEKMPDTLKERIHNHTRNNNGKVPPVSFWKPCSIVLSTLTMH